MRPKRPVRPPPPPPPLPAVVTPENLDAINTPAVDELPAYISIGKFQWKPPLPGPKGDTGAPGAPGQPGQVVRPITPPIETAEIGNGQVTHEKLSFTPVARPLVPPIVAGEIATDAVETAKIKDGNVTPAKASVGFGRYVPRACGALDFTLVNFTADGALHADGLDLSAIVPAGATAAHLLIVAACAAALGTALFCSNQTDKLYNRRLIGPAALGVSLSTHPIIMLDADRMLDYNISPNITTLGVAVLGWFI